jgi:hypothetical protein
MGLPLVVDIAIGLIFIYLILSLLASEVQEVLTTIFQWRAKHLQESIQTLLTGETDDATQSTLTPEQLEVLQKGKQLTQSLYGHPLIKSLNYQKTGRIAQWMRVITRLIDRNPMSGPSKIPSGTFASSILETLKVDQIVRELNEEKVDGFRDRISETVDRACGHTDDLNRQDPRFPQSLRASLDEEKMNALLGIVVDDFSSKQISLNEAFNRLYRHLLEYINSAQKIPDPTLRREFLSEFSALKQEIYVEDNKQAVWLGNTATTVVQVIRAYRDLKEAYSRPDSDISQKLNKLETEFGDIYRAIIAKREEIRGVEFQITQTRSKLKLHKEELRKIDPNSTRASDLNRIVQDLEDSVRDATQVSQEFRRQLKEIEKLKLPNKIRAIIERFAGKNPEDIKAFLDTVPVNLMDNMTAIAEKTQATIADKIEDVEEDLAKFRGGVETWFDNGMERASGVFKRNSKGFAFVLGLVIAMVANVDTFYMVDQLSSDSNLRNSLVQSAETTAASDVAPESREDIENTLGVSIEDAGLPIGWSPDNMDQQLIYRMSIKPDQEAKELVPNEETGRLTYRNPDDYPTLKRFWGWFKQVGGWIVSGVAISMGSPFWFGLLNQIVDLKNVGSGKSDNPKSEV